MRTLAYFFLGFAEVLAIVASCLHFHRRGYKKGTEHALGEGYNNGFVAGHASAEKWLEELEVGVQEAREKIWMEGE
jgi:hypothetical protein